MNKEKVKNIFPYFKENGLKLTLLKIFRGVTDRIILRILASFYIPKHFKNRNGLEIGGPSPLFFSNDIIPIYRYVAKLDGVNFSEVNVWGGSIDVSRGYLVEGKVMGAQFISDATNLAELPQNYYDFILSCNNIEHLANPLKAVEKWVSLLKSGGILLVVAPRKDHNFDHKRRIVNFSHLLDDYNNHIDERDLSHLDEILALHDLNKDSRAGTYAQFCQRSINNFDNRCLHQHVFDLGVLSEIYKHFNVSTFMKYETYADYIIIGKKEMGVMSSGGRRNP